MRHICVAESLPEGSPVGKTDKNCVIERDGMGEEHKQSFSLMEKMLDYIMGTEPRMRKMEFRVQVLWWVSGTLVLMIGVPLLLCVLKKWLSGWLGV
jgi:hypothetical protein